jgi:hypothetical protein
MTVSVGVGPGAVILGVYGALESGRSISWIQQIGPGWKMFGKTYEEWRELGPGDHELPDDPGDDDHGPPGTAIPA